jgi:colanic acid/amylovoran biosynthesis glycosyltransferase
VKRVVYLTQQFPVVTETFTVNEVVGLKARGIDVVVRALRPPPGDRDLDGLLLPTAGIVSPLRARPGNLMRVLRHGPLAANSRRALAALRGAGLGADLDGDRDHVHAQFPLGASTTAYFAGIAGRASFSFSGHTYHRLELMPEKLASARFVVVGSDFEQALLQRRYGDQGRDSARVLRLGVPTRAPRADFVPQTVVSVGTLTGKKGHDVLIRAVGELRRRGLAVRCEIIGEGPDRAVLQALVATLGLSDHVFLPGALEHDEALARIGRAQMFALCCRETSDGDHDCLPVALMDAMSLAVPCVSSAAFGIPELIEDGHSGLLAPPEDVQAVADRLEAIATGGSLGEELGAAGLEVVRSRYDLERNLDALADVFRAELG